MEKRSIDEVEIIVGKSLTIGVLCSAAIILIGFVLLLVTGASGYPQDSYPTNPLTILRDATALKPYAIILTGLFILILTPVFRVGVSIIVFLKEKDYRYAIITAVVFIILLISFLLGKVE